MQQRPTFECERWPGLSQLRRKSGICRIFSRASHNSLRAATAADQPRNAQFLKTSTGRFSSELNCSSSGSTNALTGRASPDPCIPIHEHVVTAEEVSAMPEIIGRKEQEIHRVNDPVCGMAIDVASARHRSNSTAKPIIFAAKGVPRSSVPIQQLICERLKNRQMLRPPRRPRLSTPAPCIPKYASRALGAVRNVACLSNLHSYLHRCVPSTPARCTRRSYVPNQGHARNAACLRSRARSRRRSGIPSMTTCADDSGSALPSRSLSSAL